MDQPGLVRDEEKTNTDRSKHTKAGLGGVGSPLETTKHSGSAECSFYSAEQRGGVIEHGAGLRVHSCIEEAGSANLSRSSLQTVNIQEGESYGGHFLYTLSAFTH